MTTTDQFRQFIRFGLIGGSGVIVNNGVVIICKRLFGDLWQIQGIDPFLNLLGSPFHIRWYHIFMTIGFCIANLWNYQLNRIWTFDSRHRPQWFKGFLAFFITGIGALVVTLTVGTLLLNPTSPIALPTDIFDGSTGFRTPEYWANLIGTCVAMPVNFIFNKIWTFRKSKLKVIEDVDPLQSSPTE